MELESVKVPLHESVTQPVLIAGGERELIIPIAFMAAITWVAGKDLLAIGLAIAIWIIGSLIAREAAKEDAQRTKIFLRHVKYQAFYPATEKLNAPMVPVKSLRG